jgi:four helix bundle protein
MQNFRNLKVCEKAHALTLEIYKFSKTFPRDEMCGLTSQMRRASLLLARTSLRDRAEEGM